MVFPKKKVQAQRKFAQSVIPPISERRSEVKEDDKKIPTSALLNFHVNMPAVRLLDMVALQNTYPISTSLSPIVLVEKLQQENVADNNKSKTKRKSQSRTRDANIATNIKENKITKVNDHKVTDTKLSDLKVNETKVNDPKANDQKRHTMLSRSMAKKRPVNKEPDEVPKIKAARSKSPEFSTDDETPLNQMTHTPEQHHNGRLVIDEDVSSPAKYSDENSTRTSDKFYYTPNQIEKWIVNSSTDKEEHLEKANKKADKELDIETEKELAPLLLNKPTTSVYDSCQSTKQKTKASKSSEYVRDVYQFDETETISDPILRYQDDESITRKNLRHANEVANNKEPKTEQENEEKMGTFTQRFVDLLTHSSLRVELVNCTVDGNTIVKAKIVPKTNEIIDKKNKADKVDINSSEKSTKKSKTKTEAAKVLVAPVFYPTKTEFENPFAYIKTITSVASSYGICKIVPPKGFNPDCHIEEDTRFTVTNQYLNMMFHRWGPAAKELCAIKTYLATQQIKSQRLPLIDSVEVNLTKLYNIVERMGGLKKVIESDMWSNVADEMNYQKGMFERKLDQVYVKFLLPYATLTAHERQIILSSVEKGWLKRYQRMLDRAQRPLHKQRQMLGLSDCEDEDDEDEDDDENTLAETDDCVVTGRNMNLTTFEKIARTVKLMHFGSLGREPTTEEVEAAYWRIVLEATEHVCVNSAAIDTGAAGYGFCHKNNKGDPYSRHPWNLKTLSSSPECALRSLGPVLSVTVPTLHLGMTFSTSCWHRDPHALPWIEYLHSGPPKIWYGIPDEQSDVFRKAVEVLCPAYCQNKPIWLPSDITMIPPELLSKHNVMLTRTTQKPGEFVIIFPKAYSCSICTGYTISESVYYAPTSWLSTIQREFQTVRESFEPTMFSLEQLVLSIANDPKASREAVTMASRALEEILSEEVSLREELQKIGIKMTITRHPLRKKTETWNVRQLHECDICRSTLYLSEVSGLTDFKSLHCLRHAQRMLTSPALPKTLKTAENKERTTLICYYTVSSLEMIRAKLRKHLDSANTNVAAGTE